MSTSEGNLREQILVAAKGLFIEQGYHGLAMRQISEAIGVTKAALYYHFKDKEELFLAILEKYLDEMEIFLDDLIASPSTSSEKLSIFVKSILEQPADQRAIIRLASQEMGQLSQDARQKLNARYHKKFIDKVTQIIQTGIEQKEFRSLPPELATWALLGIMYPYFYPAHTGSKPVPAETVREISAIFLNGIAQQK